MADQTNPFTEQLAALQLRLANLVPTERWTDLQKNAHDRAFAVAGAMKADLLKDFALAVTQSIEQGQSLDEFRKSFDSIVDKTGWNYRGSRDWRSRVIYKTNMSTSYAAGRYAQLTDPGLQQTAPYWMYRHGGSTDPRIEHLKWDKLTLKATDPWWQTHYPPNGWGCSCYVIAVSQQTAERIGGRFETPSADGLHDIDPGWDYAPGASVANEIRRLVEQKQTHLPDTLSQAFSQAMLNKLGDQLSGEQP
jgi:hypothetical protein